MFVFFWSSKIQSIFNSENNRDTDVKIVTIKSINNIILKNIPQIINNGLNKHYYIVLK